MNKLGYMAIVAALPFSVSAQSAVDAYTLSQNETRGTARFMAMGGAFTALGGDLSTLNQNPAGIGVYRGSDVGFTLDVNIMNAKSSGISQGSSWNRTHVDVNNFGYIGTYNLNNSVMQTFSWGVSYGRVKSFDRQYRGAGMPLASSLSNYIALMTDGTDPYRMMFYDKQSEVPDGLNIRAPYNPYRDSRINWLSILGFSGGVVNPSVAAEPLPDGTSQTYLTDIYNGLFQHPDNGISGDPTTGVGEFMVQERGYVDEYNINFGGNLANTVYWGLGIGITDLNYEQSTYYSETLTSANVPVGEPIDGITEGNCDWELNNWKKITGTGVNLKLGLIFKPINEFRLGLAVHTPTWYSLSTSYYGNILFGSEYGFQADQSTDTADGSWNLTSPWKLMVGAAGVIGGRGIISVDYEYDAYGNMKTSDSGGDLEWFNQDIKNYFKASNTLRLGAELRVTPQFSLRAGYSYSSTNVKNEVADGAVEVVTVGTNPAYTLNNDINTVSAGLGYRTGGFYADFAFVHRHTASTYQAFTSFEDYNGKWIDAPKAKMDFNSNQLVFTVGYKF